MTAKRLTQRPVEKPWGRRDLPRYFERFAAGRNPIGEIWFEDRENPDRQLLVKYLFTSERLSIQVHPDREAATAAGYPDGKDEAWLIVAAEEGAEIGLGLRERISPGELRAAALDGTIVDFMDWRPAAAGDFYYSPAGTVHALGPGLSLIEVQQNVDATYRLYDYGRPRELHLDEAIAVANPGPFEKTDTCREIDDGRVVLKGDAAFVVERWTGTMSGTLGAAAEMPVWIIPLAGTGSIDGEPLRSGDVWVADDRVDLTLDMGAEALVAYEAEGYRRDLIC